MPTCVVVFRQLCIRRWFEPWFGNVFPSPLGSISFHRSESIQLILPFSFRNPPLVLGTRRPCHWAQVPRRVSSPLRVGRGWARPSMHPRVHETRWTSHASEDITKQHARRHPREARGPRPRGSVLRVSFSLWREETPAQVILRSGGIASKEVLNRTTFQSIGSSKGHEFGFIGMGCKRTHDRRRESSRRTCNVRPRAPSGVSARFVRACTCLSCQGAGFRSKGRRGTKPRHAGCSPGAWTGRTRSL